MLKTWTLCPPWNILVQQLVFADLGAAVGNFFSKLNIRLLPLLMLIKQNSFGQQHFSIFSVSNVLSLTLNLVFPENTSGPRDATCMVTWCVNRVVALWYFDWWFLGMWAANSARKSSQKAEGHHAWIQTLSRVSCATRARTGPGHNTAL